MQDSQTYYRTKLRIIAFFFLCGVLSWVVRLWYLQITHGDYFALRSMCNYTRTQPLPSLRGDLYDTQGSCIAGNIPVYNISLKGRDQRSPAAQKVLRFVADVLRKPLFLLEESMQKHHGLIADGLSFDQLCKIIEYPDNIERFLQITQQVRRWYPYGVLASHVVGYVSALQMEGKSGLERVFEHMLQGQDGAVQRIVNARGGVLSQQLLAPAEHGKTLNLTLDMRMQRIAHELFQPGQKGACIVMDPASGAIKTLVSYPEYDPNIFLGPLSPDVWQRMQRDKPFLNRACAAVYPPASLFKIITYAAGLERGVVTPDTKMHCAGSITVGGHRYWCIRRWGHNTLTMHEAMAVSCNCACYQIAQQLSIDDIAEYAYRFGLGRSCNFLLPEHKGLIPTSRWKMAIKREPWWMGETLSCSIGQSYVSSTPLQIARMIGGVCIGFLVQPRLLQDAPQVREPLPVSQQTLQFLREAMNLVVQRGSGRLLSKTPEFQIYAKTGTAQTVGLIKGKKRQYHEQEHAWLAAYFSYRNEKPLVIVVLIEHAGSARSAVYYTRRFLERYGLLRQSLLHGKLCYS